jgi:hypothetical protein
MNQRADSLKKNLQANVAKCRFNHCGGLLSHTQDRVAAANVKSAKIESKKPLAGVPLLVGAC